MGINIQSLQILNRNNLIKEGISMLELGCQNMYAETKNYGEIAKLYFERLGIKHTSIDISGEQMSLKLDLRDDLRDDLSKFGKFDIVTDFGTIEHVEGFLYQPFKNIHDACALNGYMVHELPKIGSWLNHCCCYYYFDYFILKQIADVLGYRMIEGGQYPAHGNEVDGWLVYAIYKKVEDVEFCTLEKFNQIKFHRNEKWIL